MIEDLFPAATDEEREALAGAFYPIWPEEIPAGAEIIKSPRVPNNHAGATGTRTNPIIYKTITAYYTNNKGEYLVQQEIMPYLMFAPHCDNCGKPVEIYEGVPVGAIYPLDTFSCQECREFLWAMNRYVWEQSDKGEWSEEQIDAYVKRWFSTGLTLD